MIERLEKAEFELRVHQEKYINDALDEFSEGTLVLKNIPAGVLYEIVPFTVDDTNSWDGDFWANSDDGRYEIFGNMYYGEIKLTKVK